MADKSSINYEQIFKSLLSAVPLPVFVIDRTLSICHANKYGLRSSGLTRLIPDTKLDQVVPDAAIVKLAQECISTGKPQNGQYDKSGSDNAWRISVTPLAHRPEKAQKKVQQDSWGERLAYEYFAVIIEDLTEPRRLERVQRDFLANISHELRTPLTSVRLLAETLEDTIETDPDQAQQFVEKIETEVEYLSGLVGELLELSRIESGQLPMTIEPIGAEQLVHEVMARMLPLAQRHRVRLRTDVTRGGILVAADSKLITRVLFNLVHNAIKFTPSGGTIVIGTSPQASQPMQRFFVHDTGVGIRPEDLPRVFERFYKTDRARSKADFIGPGGGGTGLGLAIARHVVEAHGGRISAESTVGQGSTFTFTLPLALPST